MGRKPAIPDDQANAALTLFLGSDKSLAVIATDLKVSKDALYRLARREKWEQRKAENATKAPQTVRQMVAEKAADKVAQAAIPLGAERVQVHLTLTARLLHLAEQALRDDATRTVVSKGEEFRVGIGSDPESLKKIAETIKTAVQLERQALQLGDTSGTEGTFSEAYKLLQERGARYRGHQWED